MVTASDTAVEDISGIVDSVRKAYVDGVTRPIAWRREQLERLGKMIEENEDEIVAAIGKDLRRPRVEAVLTEVVDVLGNVKYLLENLDKFTKKEKLKAALSQKPISFEVWKEPLGVVTIIAPWNFPFQLLFCPLVGAIAAGNACVLKPSEVAVASSELIAKLVRLYLDPAAIRVVTGGVEQSTELLKQKVNHIMYTGGGAVGRIVMAAAAKNLTPVTLELGGQCPAFVDKSANLETTSRRLLWSKSINGGQLCMSPNHVFVDEKVRDSFLATLKAEYARMYPGDRQKNPDLSRIINDRHFQRVTGLMEDHGGEVCMGGDTVESDRFIDMTVVLDPHMDSKLMKEEIFGPLLPVITVKSIEEAIAMTNERPSPLASYIFTRDKKTSDKWLAEVECGGASVNDCLIHSINLEETGLAGKGESGMGRARGKSAFDTFTHRKTVGIQAPNFDPLIKYPPYQVNSMQRFPHTRWHQRPPSSCILVLVFQQGFKGTMTVATDTPVQDISGIVDSVRKAYVNGVTRPIEWRREQLKGLRTMMEENEDEIVAAIDKDLRRPRAEAVMAEAVNVICDVNYFLENLDRFTKKEKLKAAFNQKPVSYEVWKEPLGVVTIIAPWNFPFMLLLCPLAGAIAAGNACVLKPSEIGPASSELIARLVPRYLDPSAICVISGGVPQATELLKQKVNHIMYTGGGAVGRIVMAAAAKNLTPVTLELGGQCPAFVDKTANLETTCRRLLWTKNMNSGQMCISPNHVLLDETVRESFLATLKTEQARMFPGDRQKNPDLSRIISDRHFQRITGLLEDHGGEVYMGGDTVESERFIDMTVVLNPDMDSKLMQEEIFGPILPIITVKSIEEAIAMTNNGPSPLASYVFTRDKKISDKWLAEVESGGAAVNDCLIHCMNLDETGLAGKGESGMGRAKGKAAFDTFTHRKTVGIQSANFDPLIKYPPYQASNEKFIKFVVIGAIPQWAKLAFWGSAGALMCVAASFVARHVSVDFKISLH